MTTTASIWAQDRGGVLGSGGGMLWHVPADFAHFKAATMGCPIIMGRHSWEALGGALPGRANIVITGSREYRADGADLVHSLDEALERARSHAEASGAATIWIIGGASVYEQAMPLVDELVVTDIDCDATAGHDGPVVYAPGIDASAWDRDEERSDAQWREPSGGSRWRVTTWVRARR